MQAAPVASKPLLRMTAGFPENVAAGEGGGTIPVNLAIENTSHVTAQLPFLCVTDLGFNIHPAAHGQMEKISSDGRRLVRFLLAPGTCLRGGESASICGLMISWHGGNPPFVAFDLGTGVALDALRDLRMFYVTGAANFPSERSHLILSCADIGAAVAAASGMPGTYVPANEARPRVVADL